MAPSHSSVLFQPDGWKRHQPRVLVWCGKGLRPCLAAPAHSPTRPPIVSYLGVVGWGVGWCCKLVTDATSAPEKPLQAKTVSWPHPTKHSTVSNPAALEYGARSHEPSCTPPRWRFAAPDCRRCPCRRGADRRRGRAHADDSQPDTEHDRGRRNLAQVREPAVHRRLQGARRAQRHAPAHRGAAAPRRDRRLGRQSCAGPVLSRRAARHPGDDRDAAYGRRR